MHNLPMVDVAVLAVVLVSALFATIRGFTQEIFSVGGWVAAALAALFGLPFVRPFARGMIATSWIADLAAGAGLFVCTLIVMSVITRRLSSSVRGSALGPADRALGFAFGALRGAVLIVLAYLAMMWILDAREPPRWLANARTGPWIARGAEAVRGWIPASLTGGEEARAAEKSSRAVKDAIALERTIRAWSEPATKAPETGTAAPGYADDQRREMNRLIDANR